MHFTSTSAGCCRITQVTASTRMRAHARTCSKMPTVHTYTHDRSHSHQSCMRKQAHASCGARAAHKTYLRLCAPFICARDALSRCKTTTELRSEYSERRTNASMCFGYVVRRATGVHSGLCCCYKIKFKHKFVGLIKGFGAEIGYK